MKDLELYDAGIDINGYLESLPSDDEPEVFIRTNYSAGCFIGKAESIQIIKHLIAVFEIDKDEVLG